MILINVSSGPCRDTGELSRSGEESQKALPRRVTLEKKNLAD